ncbi:hypothetical protein [Streptomyces goshikiensis]|uniref:hypothetical protein n=1 Tax=Streptomyces goshikiensis TaxID=1942 RepID=UPI002E10A0E8|nr:hypothetical protein OG224_00005 [Streptomyces goshikiensis]WSS02996.1 hypothetical protein OG224_35810 [Streptomyces goshikiensis]WSS03948.1 hypothetical protein OG224_38655 [Streptomyces goshikiensis]
MPTRTAEELLASTSGLSNEQAQQIADHIDECRNLLTAGTAMDTVQQHLKDQGIPTIRAILITTRLIGNHPSRLRAAREIVECSPARTPDTALSRPRHPAP